MQQLEYPIKAAAGAACLAQLTYILTVGSSQLGDTLHRLAIRALLLLLLFCIWLFDELRTLLSDRCLNTAQDFNPNKCVLKHFGLN